MVIATVVLPYNTVIYDFLFTKYLYVIDVFCGNCLTLNPAVSESITIGIAGQYHPTQLSII